MPWRGSWPYDHSLMRNVRTGLRDLEITLPLALEQGRANSAPAASAPPDQFGLDHESQWFDCAPVIGMTALASRQGRYP